ncbi:putative Poly(A) RNA polymerase cid14 [Carpediemonas membranifera]|uniref:Putative Poly(A) RNA polymerase cid14 n=1 Tax=Carpediemonas membranifera TaxID=201153 RepID=A0A8J6AWG2_9EUKA|nr:putative Poly(A) RNA polymerase cid14 [Carpediemonas membranifera]|eukprot:KAG9395893.1 putative Poly(A) RNA polymerase cid14 [Carpediemonas membranifera]
MAAAAPSGNESMATELRHYSDARWGEFCLSAVCHRVADIIAAIQPMQAADEYRAGVFDFVKSLIIECHGECPILPVGSVPIRTYLPDGDIDIACLFPPHVMNNWFIPLKEKLEEAQERPNAPFAITDVTPIFAEVMIIKCRVGSIPIDISATQSAGIFTAVFFERVNRQFGQNDLFKRTVIITKAWASYEARILGSHHSLISTYSLQTMLLHIFATRRVVSPLQGLAMFVEYYATFDWDNNGLSICGPIPAEELEAMDPSSDAFPRPLPPVLAPLAEDLNELIRIRRFAHTSAGRAVTPFRRRYMDILDPLAAWNNIGRSVALSNRLRIRRAFEVGKDSILALLNGAKSGRTTLPKAIALTDMIFANTWVRADPAARTDVVDMATLSPNDELHWCSNEAELRANAMQAVSFMSGLRRWEAEGQD